MYRLSRSLLQAVTFVACVVCTTLPTYAQTTPPSTSPTPPPATTPPTAPTTPATTPGTTPAPAPAPPTETVTGGETVQVPFRPINPRPAVPIPGVSFSSARESNGSIQIPFLAQYISGIYRLSVGLGAILAAIMIVYGGFRYMLAASLPDVKDGKTIIQDAFIGLVVLLSSFLILKTINPALVSPAVITIDRVQRQNPNTDSIEESIARNAGPDLSEVTTVPGDAPYSGGQPMPSSEINGSGRVSTGGSSCAGRVDVGTPLERSGWKRTLRRTPGRDGFNWCQDCPSVEGARCGDDNAPGPDPTCMRITGEHGADSCGKQFGLYLRSVTGGCLSKKFDSIEGLDGITFGIRGTWAEGMADMMARYVNEDRVIFEDVFRNAHLSEWYQNGTVNESWFCQKQLDLHGLDCDVPFRTALKRSGQHPILMRAQLRKAWRKFSLAYNRASRYFQSDYGRIMWSVLANNPGGHNGSCDLPALYNACRSAGNEPAIIECIIGNGTSNIGKFAEHNCRGGRASALGRSRTIISRLEGVSRTSAVPITDTLESVMARCVGTGASPTTPAR